MSYTVATLTNDISSVIHGTTTNKVPNIYGHINRAARDLLLDVDPKETQRIVQLASQVFDDVFDYPIPVDVKGDRIVDLRLTAGRIPREVFVQDYAVTFDSTKSLGLSNGIYTQWNTGVKSLRIEAPFLTAPVQLSSTSSTDGWAATPGASDLSLDSTNYVAGGGALVFNLDADSATGYVENSTLTALDLSSHLNASTLFTWVYFPAGSDMTSVTLRWGSSSSDYYSSTVTSNQQGVSFQNGWNLCAFPWVSATTVGTPDDTAIDYVRVSFAYDSTLQTGVKVCNIVSTLGYIFELQYYSKYLFRNASTNVFQETVADETESNLVINLDTESYNLLFNKTAFYVAQALQGADAAYDATFWDAEYQKSLLRYQKLNPSEAIKKSEVYYQMPKKSFSRFNPGFWWK